MDTKPARNKTIDVFRILAAVMIVMVHTKPLRDISDIGDFILTDIVCRLAVPFFVICSGYFLSAKAAAKSEQEIRRIVWCELKKLAKLYLIFSLIYLAVYIPNWISTGWFSAYAFVDWFIAALRNGSYYHLWYLLAMLYLMIALLVVFPVLLPSRTLRWSAIILLGTVEALEYAYRQFLPAPIVSLFDICDLFGCAFYAIVRFMPYFLLGTCLYEAKRNGRIRKPQLGFAASALLLASEVFFLRFAGGTRFSYTFMMLPTSFFLFGSLLNCNIKADFLTKYNLNLPELSLLIYCIHPAVLQVVDLLKIHSLIRFLLTLGGTMLISLIYCCFRKQGRR